MNICIVSNFKQTGYGESTRPGQLAKYLRSFGHNVLHICDWSGTINGIEHLHVVRDNWEPNRLKRIFSFIKNYSRIFWFNPDFIYVHQFNNAKWAIKTALLKNKRIVFDAHTSIYFEQLHFTDNQRVLDALKYQENDICQYADFIIAASDETRNFLIATYSINPAKIATVGNATDIAPIQKQETNSTNNFVCLTTLPQDGFISNKMALEMLLEIAAEVYKVNNQIQFQVIGGGEMPISKSTNVTYTGYVKDLRQTILNANICLMPFPENAVCGGARNKFCDYIALGKAVITTKEGLRGMEILMNEKNCIEANTVSQFVSIINDAALNRSKINTIEKEVYSIRNYFNWQDRALKVQSVFNQFIKE